MNVDYKQLEFINETMRSILEWLEDETGVEFTITSLYRIADRGTHGTLPLRGVDLRCRNKRLGQVVEQLINDNWQYDPKRREMKCAILHGEGYGLHLHLQVHPNTKRTW